MPDPARQPGRGHVALETTEPMSFGYGFISGLLSAILGIAGFGLVLGLRFPEYLTLADLRPLYSSRLPARDHPRHARRVVPAGQRQRLAPREQGAGPDGHRVHAGGGAAGWLAGPGDGAVDGSGVLAGRRFLRAEPRALLRGLHSPRAALRVARRPAGVPPPLAGRPDVFLHQLAADRDSDDLYAQAGADPVRLGACGLGERVPSGRCRSSLQVPALVCVADFTQYLGASDVSRRAVSLALSRHPSLGRGDGLAGGIAAAPGGCDRHARADLRPDLRPGLLGAPR